MKKRDKVVWGSILLLYGLIVLAIVALRRGSLGIGTIAFTVVASFCLLAFGFFTLLGRERGSFAPHRGFVVFLFPLALLVLTAAAPGTPAIGSVALTTPKSPAEQDLEVDAFASRFLSEEGPVVFDEASYFHLHDALTTYPELAAGRGVRIDGFLSLTGPEGPVIGRYLLWCCGSDALFLGMSLDGELPEVPEGTWIEVSGRLSTTVVREGGSLVQRPVISVEETRILDEPEFVYVLPF